ncbi:HNH endonuclease [Bosea sp. RAC05]|uniref:HNH endonuclease n=1 Tax=unclassified Bosea (in: a-proteobacteria) TaxID=2653178 RepID=UPI00083E1EA9|nr:HNH endonuclease [Bosea sp. RAC05]AOG07337.1 HNH endonuclease family protein [Bosea sp. RAC05]
MAFGVFIHRPDSIYDDSPAERYQFPRPYLGRVRACIDDWIIYYEPRKLKGTRGYYAIARVQEVIPDPAASGMYVAIIEPGSYLDFARPVPFADADGAPVERGVLNEDGRISGRAQAAVRPISPTDFDRILALGLDQQNDLLPRSDQLDAGSGFAETQAPFVFEQERERLAVVANRVVRDRVFRRVVLRAYDERCAITGLKLINGGGRAEVDAAHIRPVEANGPDVVNNGIALSGTAHWMFDRGLISLSDDLDILISRQANDPDGIRSFVNRAGRAFAPHSPRERPHPRFLQWHRENCFKQ